ncbi:MAG: hypothetical protein HYY30_11885 [Chloroflexi bacterium]|nr:hypothetical protein [Chloroflexota bacterium]
MLCLTSQATHTGTAGLFLRAASFLAIFVIASGLFASPAPAGAATGDLLRTIAVNPDPGCPNEFLFGVAFDGQDLLVSCSLNNVITRVNPANGAVLGSISVTEIPSEQGIHSISWDAKNNQLWAGTMKQGVSMNNVSVYTISLDKTAGTSTAMLRFEATLGVRFAAILDGLAYDGTDDTLWVGVDRSGTIVHFSQTGTQLGSIDVLGKLGGPGRDNSGIAIADAATLYVANAVGRQVFSVTKDGGSINFFANAPLPPNFPLEDLECDSTTFAPKSAFWTTAGLGLDLFAFEVPAGQCAQGGVLGPVPPPGPTPTPTPPPGPPPPPTPGDVCPPTAPFFPETGFCIDNPAIQAYFQGRGGTDTFGFPVSRSFVLLGFAAQVFQRHVLRVHPDGVRPVNLLDPDVLPVTTVNFATFPANDPALAASAPPPTTPNYGNAVLAHLQANVPDSFEGVNVQFLQSYLAAGQQAAQMGDFGPLVALEIWGFPTSRPARDPNNANFIYQRFQRAILHSFPDPNNPAVRITRGILLADNLKFVLTDDPVLLSADLRAQVQNSRFFNQYCPNNLAWLCRPAELPDTDLTAAFEKQQP